MRGWLAVQIFLELVSLDAKAAQIAFLASSGSGSGSGLGSGSGSGLGLGLGLGLTVGLGPGPYHTMIAQGRK